MKTRQANSPVSLFPFLAVLVCAMGALIFLLLIATRRIRADAIQRAQQQPDIDQVDDRLQETVVAEIPTPPVVDWEAMLSELAGRRDRQQQRLQKLQQQHKQRQARQVANKKQSLGRQKRLRQLGQQEKALTEKSGPLQREIVALRDELERLELELENLRQRRRQEKSRFTFLPFDGVAGTHRRPIFIECHDEKIVFASEEIDLAATDIEGFTLDVNPLLAGTRALVDYWHSHDREQSEDGKSPRPYVLLIVRPGGIRAFYIARQLLRRLEEPIGYELVPEDLPLSWTPRDAQAVTACRDAVDKILAGRQQLAGRGIGLMDGSAKGRGGPRRQGAVMGRPFEGPVSRMSRDPRFMRSSRSRTEGLVSQQRNEGTTRAQSGIESRQEPTDGQGLKQARSNRSGPKGSGPKGSGPKGSGPKGSGPKGSGQKGSGQKGSGPKGSESVQPDVGSGALKGLASSEAPGVTQPAGPVGNASSSASAAASSGIPRIPTFGSLSLNGSRAERSSHSRNDRSRGQRGRESSRWGIVGLRATIGYERRVRVRVEQNQVLVAAEPPIDAGVGVSARELRGQVVAALQRTARTWGPPPDRFYWVPAVVFQVSPGGHLHYERLNDHLRDWALPTSVKFVLKSESAETGFEEFLR